MTHSPDHAERVAVIIGAIQARKDIYEHKRDAADPFADDDCNKYERMQHTIEAFDYLLDDIAALHDAKEAGDVCPYTTAPRREGDEWACRCGKRWPVGEEHP